MKAKDFQSRIKSAADLIRRDIDYINKQHRSQLVNPYDTGCGADWHNYMCNERARQNAKVSRQYDHQCNQYYDVLDKIKSCNTPEEVWKALAYDCLGYKQHQDPDTGAIKWRTLMASDIAKHNYIYGVWRIVYGCFWE